MEARKSYVFEDIEKQITQVRNIDAETSKPRLDNTERDRPHKPKASKPKGPTQTVNAILTPYLRTTLSGLTAPEVSTFTPSAYRMYYIVHVMDDLLRKNSYFKKQEDAWHPFITRIYTGILFYVQTLRAEQMTNIISPRNRRFLKKFFMDYPPETLPVPGPLVALFEALSPTTPQDTLSGPVTPATPRITVPFTNNELLPLDQGHTSFVMSPYIPGLLSFANSMLTPVAQPPPDYTVRTTFDHTAARTLCGNALALNAWQLRHRVALLLPGMLHTPETSADIDLSFQRYGPRLGLPNPTLADEFIYLDQYLYLNDSNTWFGKIIQIMTTYSSYFAASCSLAECSSNITAAPLILTTLPKPTAVTLEQNCVNTLTYAFPSEGVFTEEAVHSTFELTIPPTTAIVAEMAQLNIIFSTPGLNPFSHIGEIGLTRQGPYWERFPIHNTTSRESSWKSLGTIVSEKFLLLRPTK